MDSDLDFYCRNFGMATGLEDEEDDEDGCDDYSLEEGWPDEEEEAA